MLKVSLHVKHMSDSPGKTTEAKSDLARLQEVRRRREAAAAQREAEAEGEWKRQTGSTLTCCRSRERSRGEEGKGSWEEAVGDVDRCSPHVYQMITSCPCKDHTWRTAVLSAYILLPCIYVYRYSLIEQEPPVHHNPPALVHDDRAIFLTIF